MPFGVGYDSPGQTPGQQQGFQQQLSQLREQMPGLIENLKSDQFRRQAAERLAGQMPAPPPTFERISGGAPTENAVGLPQGQPGLPPGANQPSFSPDPFDFPGQPPAIGQALSAQQGAANAFGAPPPGIGPGSPVGINPGGLAPGGSGGNPGVFAGGGVNDYVRALLAAQMRET